MKKLFLILFTTVSTSLFSQYLQIGGHNYPDPNVEHFAKWIDMSTSEWEAEMKISELGENRSIDDGCVFYGSGSSLNNATFAIAKCPGNMMSVHWTDFSNSGITKLDALMGEIEKYYKKTNEQGNAEYAFTLNNFVYQFTAIRENAYEIIIVKRYNYTK